MKEAGKQLFEFLTALPDFTSVMQTRLFPLIAEGDTAFPFSIYSVRAMPMSQDADDYEYTLSVFFKPNEYDECVDFCDAIKTLIEQKYQWIASETEVSEEDYSFIGIINFKN